MAMNQPSVQIDINEIIVRGCGPVNEQELHAAVRTELVRLFSTAERSSLTSSTDRGTPIDGGTINLTETADTAALGSQIAQAVYRGVQG